MVRTALLSALAAAGLVLPAATADAHPPVAVQYPSYPSGYYPGRPSYYPPPVCNTYRVMYRTCARDPWLSHGSYESSYRADRAARSLRHRGFEVFVAVR
jgi:hypothetical protein